MRNSVRWFDILILVIYFRADLFENNHKLLHAESCNIFPRAVCIIEKDIDDLLSFNF